MVHLIYTLMVDASGTLKPVRAVAPNPLIKTAVYIHIISYRSMAASLAGGCICRNESETTEPSVARPREDGDDCR